MNVDRTVPILRIFDVEKATQFYVGFLGFSIDWQHRLDDGAPAYLQVSRDGCTLHLTEHHGDCCPGSTAFVQVRAGLADYHREITSKGYRYNAPGIERAPWNADVMEVTDPFGNRLRFSQPLR
jgi:catechol 2,3-dioxygenase-like lactoylglutathione lyase family enzyme